MRSAGAIGILEEEPICIDAWKVILYLEEFDQHWSESACRKAIQSAAFYVP